MKKNGKDELLGLWETNEHYRINTGTLDQKYNVDK